MRTLLPVLLALAAACGGVEPSPDPLRRSSFVDGFDPPAVREDSGPTSGVNLVFIPSFYVLARRDVRRADHGLVGGNVVQ